MPKLDFTIVGGRTFFLTMGCGIVTSAMRWFDHLDNGSFTAVTIATVGAYIAANAVNRHTDTRADVQKTIAAAQADAPPPVVVDQVKD